jgi:putative hemolysin
MSDAFLWALLGTLVLVSAWLSASETALFSLTAAERRRARPSVSALLDRPRSVLVTVLLANLIANLAFFAFAARLFGDDAYGELAAGIAALVVLVLFAETLPKIFALRARLAVAHVSAVPLAILVKLATPVRRAVDQMLELIYRALGDAGREEAGVTTEGLALALEKSAEHGLLLGSEAELLTGLVELQAVRVRELMTPRVDMVFVDKSGEDRGPAIERALAAKLPWLVVIDGEPDRIVGRVRLRDLLSQPDRPLGELISAVKFVPEVASAPALLAFLREHRIAQAVAIDEWGGTAGLVTIEDVFEALVGDLRVEGESAEVPFVDLGDGSFRVSGSLSIRDWNELFGHRVVATEFDTVGGFVTALLGRIPRAGDLVRSGPLEFRVHEVRRRRIVGVDMRVESNLPRAAGATERGVERRQRAEVSK